MKIKNFKGPLMCIVFSTTLFIASTFTSCQKDETVAPSGSNSSSTNKGNNIGVVISDTTTTSGTKTGTSGGTKTGTTGGTTTGTSGGTKTGTTGGSTTGTTGGSTTGTKTGTTGGTTTGTTTGSGTKTGTGGGTTTGGSTGGTATGGGSATGGGTTTGSTGSTGTSSSSNTTYTASGPITAKSNTTYSNLLIDLGNSSTTGISLNGVTNVHITNCKIINAAGFAININNCSNITVDNTFLSNVGFGISAYNSQSIKVNSNQMLNINGINTSFFGHAVQYNQVSGSGNQINNNRIENIAGVALHPHDILNVYESDGLPGDSIQVIGNWIRGGQMSLWPTSGSGAAGIVLGDLGGSYQVARNNILVNPGYVGMQAQGGTHIKMDHNLIYSSSTPASLVGMAWGNWSGKSSSDVTYAYNQVKWYNSKNQEDDAPAGTSGLTEINNTWGANLDASILPATIITMN